METLALGAMGLGGVVREYADVALSCGLMAEGDGVVDVEAEAVAAPAALARDIAADIIESAVVAVIETPATPARRSRKGGAA